MKYCIQRRFRGRVSRGFTLPELMLVLTTVGIVGGIGVVSVTKVREAALEVKLENDVAALNSALRAYEGSVGSLPDGLTAGEVLERLKATVSADDAMQIVGHRSRGPFLNPRVRGRSSLKTGQRAVWNSVLSRFGIGDIGPGFKEFYFDENAGKAVPESEPRKTQLNFAKVMGWVRDFGGVPNRTLLVPLVSSAEEDFGCSAKLRGQSAPESQRHGPGSPTL